MYNRAAPGPGSPAQWFIWLCYDRAVEFREPPKRRRHFWPIVYNRLQKAGVKWMTAVPPCTLLHSQNHGPYSDIQMAGNTKASITSLRLVLCIVEFRERSRGGTPRRIKAISSHFNSYSLSRTISWACLLGYCSQLSLLSAYHWPAQSSCLPSANSFLPDPSSPSTKFLTSPERS